MVAHDSVRRAPRRSFELASLLVALALAACGDDSNPSPTGTFTTATTGTGGAGTGGQGSGGAAGTGGDGSGGSCEGPNGCFSCTPNTTPEFLNACTDGQCSPFDDVARLPLYNGGDLPDVP